MMTKETIGSRSCELDPASLIESKVVAKLGGRLRNFHLDEVGGRLVLRGTATSYHVKQLAQQEVMGLTTLSILQNSIEVAPA